MLTIHRVHDDDFGQVSIWQTTKDTASQSNAKIPQASRHGICDAGFDLLQDGVSMELEGITNLRRFERLEPFRFKICRA